MPTYLSIDVEASGPVPGLYSLVSVGAAPVRRVDGTWVVGEDTFYVELRPLPDAAELPEATAVHGLTRDHLEAHGREPADAMRALCDYLGTLGPTKVAAWPISFDHPFVAWYLWRFLGECPIGHSGFDIASFAMGLFAATGRNATFRAMERAGFVAPSNPHPHHGLHDAIEQAQTLAWLLNHAETQ